MYPVSTEQCEEQPSASERFPSSQVSPDSLIKLPHDPKAKVKLEY